MAQHLRPSKNIKPKVTFKEGLRLWLNSWKWNSIKSQYNKEYARVHGNSQYIMHKIDEKIHK